MKVGFRKPSVKRSVKARTTGRVKRTLKKSVNPLYGKKGMGYIKNPKKAIYNKIYHKTSIDSLASFKHRESFGYDPDRDYAEADYTMPSSSAVMVLLYLISIILIIYTVVKLISTSEFHAICFIIGIVSLFIAQVIKKKNES